MKTFYVAIFLLAGVAIQGFSQSKKVPEAVKAAFAKQYPNVSADWDKEGDKFEASFKKDGIKTSVVYKADGQVEETEVAIKKDELPANAKTYLEKNYKGAAIKETAKVTKANGEINYEAEVKGKDVIFDKAGNFIKEEKD